MKKKLYSFSKINTFFECPKKFEFSYITKVDKDKEYTEPPYFRRGSFIHAYLANRLKGGDGALDKFSDIDISDKLILVDIAETALDNPYVQLSFDFDIHGIEKKIFLSEDMKPSKQSNSIMMGYIDYFAIHDDVAIIIDWKSGKYRPEASYEQLELYAIWVLEKYPDINEIDLIFYYVEHDKLSIKTISKNEISSFKDNLLSNISTIENTTEFNPTPSKRACLHCAFFNTCSDEFGIMI